MKRICLSGKSRIHALFRKGTALLCGALCLCLLCSETAAWAAEAGPPTTPGLTAETDPLSEEVSLVFGMKGDDVLKMQNALKDLGYPGFLPDGEFGENSRLAVQIFQFYNGLPVTGEADDETLTVLYQGGAERFRVLAKGDNGKAVERVQQYLFSAGFLTTKPDGNFGPGTASAVKLFQSLAGIDPQDGNVGKQTAAKMINDHLSFEPLQSGDEGDLVAVIQEKLKDLGFLQAEAGGTFDDETQRAVKLFQMYAGMEITGTADGDTIEAICRKQISFSPLNQGSKGTPVKMLQTILKELGYTEDEPDGSFGSRTKKAVHDFQAINNLGRDGSCGRNTADKLFDDPLPFDQEALDNAGNDAEAYAKLILDEIGWDLKKAYDWSVGLSYNYYLYTGNTTTESAVYSFSTHYGNCVGMASTFCWMARALGYEARVIYGHVPYRSGSMGEHAWVEIVVDGETHVCDPDFEMQMKKNGYMIDYGQSGTWIYNFGYVMED